MRRLCTLRVRLGEHRGVLCVKGANWEALGRTVALLARRAARQWGALCEASVPLSDGAREECMHSSACRRSADMLDPLLLIDVREMDFSTPSCNTDQGVSQLSER